MSKPSVQLMRVEMWTSSGQFYYVELAGVRMKPISYQLQIDRLVDGNCGDGGLLHNSPLALLSAAATNCHLADGGAWWHDNNGLCPQSSLTAHSAVWTLPNGTVVSDIGKVVIRMREEDNNAVNLVRQKAARMHAERDGHPARLCVDEDYSTNLTDCAVADPAEDGTASWSVNLGRTAYIHRIEILGKDLRGVSVLVGDTDVDADFEDAGYEMCGTFTSAEEVTGINILTCPTVIRGQYAVIIRMDGQPLVLCEVAIKPSDGLKDYGEVCDWNAQCNFQHGACKPAEGTVYNETLVCGCRDSYVWHSDLCIPMADLQVIVTDIRYPDGVPIRSIPSRVILELEVSDQAGAPLVAVPPDQGTNFLLNISACQEQMSSFNDNTSLPSIINITGHPNYSRGFDLGEVASFDVTLELSIGADHCFDAHYLCMEIVAGDASLPVSYVETDPSTNVACHPLQITCQPVLSLSVVAAYYDSGEPIIRAFRSQHVFNLTVVNDDETYDVEELQELDNYQIRYFYGPSDSDITYPAIIKSKSSRSGLVRGASTNLTFTVEEGMTFDDCPVITHICFLLYPLATASYAEMDLQDNGWCIDITNIKDCDPETVLQVDEFSLPPDLQLVRNYPETFNFSLTFTNLDPNFDVEPLADGSNFIVSIFLSPPTSLTRQRRSAGQTSIVGPFPAQPQHLIDESLRRNDSINAIFDVQVFIPTDQCLDLSQLCVEVTPTSHATYDVADGGDNILCYDSSSILNCLGVMGNNVSLRVDPLYTKPNQPVAVTVEWFQGTEVTFQVTRDDGQQIQSWNWLEANHTDHYGYWSVVTNTTFSNLGNITLRLTFENTVTNDVYVAVVCVEPDLTEALEMAPLYTPAAPPVDVVFQLSAVSGGDDNFVVWCTIHYDMQDPKPVSVSIVWLMTEGPAEISHTYASDRPQALAFVLCTNHVSQTSEFHLIKLQEAISGLNVTSLTAAQTTGDVASFRLGMLTGSHVRFEIYYGDEPDLTAAPEYLPHPYILSSMYNFTINHTYEQPGNYTLNITARNVFFEDHVILAVPIVIQNSVTKLTSDTETEETVAVPPGNISVSVYPEEPYPTDVTCDYSLGKRHILSEKKVGLSQGNNDTVLLTANREMAGEGQTLQVDCYNLASNISFQYRLSIYEVIVGLVGILRKHALPVGVNGSLTLRVDQGSDVTFFTDWGADTSNSQLSHPLLFANESAVDMEVLYDQVGNYSISIMASNPVSNVTFTTDDLIIQNIIHALIVSGNKSILWPRQMFHFTLRVGIDQEQLQNVHCLLDFVGVQVEYMYFSSLVPGTTKEIIRELPPGIQGNSTTTVNCSNLVSSQVITTETEVTLDATILDSVRCNHSVWWQNTSVFILEVARTAQFTCHQWDMGDGRSVYVYGEASCAHRLTPGTIYIASDPSLTTLVHEHTYDTWGMYIVSVYSQNDVSNDVKETRAIVWEWDCISPNITFVLNDTYLESELTKMRSDHFILEAELSIHCMWTSKTVDYFQIVDLFDDQTVQTIEDRQFEHQPRLLPYGTYSVVFQTNMLNQDDTESGGIITLKIVPSPLIVSIVGGASVRVAYGMQYLLDSASLSMDPDVEPGDLRDIQFSWTCIRVNMSELNESYADILGDQFTSIFPSVSEPPCLISPPSITGRSEAQVDVDTSQLYPMTYYDVTVVMNKDERTASFTQSIYIEPAPAPLIDIICLGENCRRDDGRVAFTKDLYLSAHCRDACATVFGNISYRWHLYHHLQNGTLLEDTNFTDYTKYGTEDDSVFLNKEQLKEGVSYTVEVRSYTPGSAIGHSNYTVDVNKAPYNGSCSIRPKSGYASETWFYISCLGWREWGNKDPKPVLRYKYVVQARDEVNKFPVSYGNTALADPIRLPVGSIDYEFSLGILTTIKDSLDDAYVFQDEVQVMPRRIDEDMLLSTIKDGIGETSYVHQMLGTGNKQKAATEIYSMISEINIPSEYYESVNTTEDVPTRKEVRSDILRLVLKEFPINSAEDLEQVNELTRVGLKTADEVDLDALALSANRLEDLGKQTQMYKDNGQVENPTLISQNLIDTAIRVMIASDANLIQEDPSLNETSNLTNENNAVVGSAMRTIVGVIDQVSDMLLDEMRPEGPDASITYAAVTVTTSVMHPASAPANVTFTSKQGQVQLPDLQTAFGDSMPSCANTKMFFSTIDPYIYGDNSGPPCVSSIMHLDVEECLAPDADPRSRSRQQRKKRSSSNPLSLTSPFTASVLPNLQQPELVNLTLASPDEYNYHAFHIASPPKPIQFDIFPIVGNNTDVSSVNVCLHLYIGVNKLPVETTHTWHILLTNETVNMTSSEELVVRVMEDYFIIFIPVSGLMNDTNSTQSDYSNNGTVYLAIRPSGCLGAECDAIRDEYPQPLMYLLRMMDVAGQRWDEDREVWVMDADGEVLEPVTATEAKFKSNLFGSLGIGVFVGPNKIDFRSVFVDFDKKLLENIAVVATVIGVILLYIPAAIWCRRGDAKDKLKFAVLGLADNSREAHVPYEIHVYTGFAKHAGTDSNVSVVLIGSAGDSGKRALTDGCQRKNFRKGEVNAFSMLVDKDLGDLYAVRVSHDNSGRGHNASWFLSKIVIVDKIKNKWYLFNCENWLATDEEEGTLVRVLTLPTVDLSVNSGDLLRSNVNRRLYDDHLWLSIVCRNTRSNFSRVQRLSCALALLYLAMITNAMFYRGNDAQTSQALHLGPFTFTVDQFQSSFISSCIVVPPILLITFCFGKAGKKKKKVPNADQKPLRSQLISRCESSVSRGVSRTKRVAFSDVVQEERSGPAVRSRCQWFHDPWPYWCIYIAWVTVVLAVAAGAFFTILYSFQWGRQKSQAWLVAFILCFIENVIIIQPAKVILAATLISFIMKKDSDVTEYESTYGGMKEDWQKASEVAGERSPWLEVPDIDYKAARARRHMEEQMSQMIREVLSQVLILILLSVVVYGNQDSAVFRQKAFLENILHSSYTKVTRRDQLLDWVSEHFLHGAYQEILYNGEPVSGQHQHYIEGGYGYRLGQPLLRQLRVIRDSCPIAMSMWHATDRCTYQYQHQLATEDTASYNNSWQYPLQRQPHDGSHDGLTSPFVYIAATALRLSSTWGEHTIYGGGGYTALLGKKAANAHKTVSQLKQSHWVDQFTRALFVQLSIFNVDSGLFSMATILFETPPTGGVSYKKNIQSIQLYRYVGLAGLASVLFELSCLVVFIWLTVRVIRQAIREGWHFFQGAWNLTYVMVILTFFTAVGLYIWRCVITVSTLEEVMNNLDLAVSFDQLVQADTLYLLFLGLTTFIITLQFLCILRYNATIGLLATTLSKSRGDLLNMGICGILVFFMFASSGHARYGAVIPDYASLAVSMQTLVLSSIGHFDYAAHTHFDATSARTFLMIYLITTLLFFINMIVTLLNEFLAAIKEDPKSQPKDHEVVDYFVTSLRSLIGFQSTRGGSQEPTEDKQ